MSSNNRNSIFMYSTGRRLAINKNKYREAFKLQITGSQSTILKYLLMFILGVYFPVPASSHYYYSKVYTLIRS